MSWSRYFDLSISYMRFSRYMRDAMDAGTSKTERCWKLASINFFVFWCIGIYAAIERTCSRDWHAAIHHFSDWCFISHQKPELSFKPLITGKTSVIINSTALLYGLAVISCCSSLPVSMINFSRQRICLFLFLFLAATCSPTPSPVQYHRPLKA